MKSSAHLTKKYIDLKLVLLLAGFYALYDLVFIIKTAFLMKHGPDKMEGFSWFHFLLENILFDFLIVVGFMVLIAISTKRFLNKNYSWTKIILIHIIFSLLMGIVIRLIFDFYLIMIGKISFDNFDIYKSFYGFIYVLDLNFLIYFAMVFIIYTYYYVKEVKKAEYKQSELKTQLVNARMKMLSSQLQPHFLFNTLNCISVLTDLDGKKAKDTIADLSDFLREILYEKESDKISLEKELHILGHYLNIIKVRFSDHLEIIKEIDQNLLSKKIPSLLLQPIMENCIKHGFSYDHTYLTIHLKIYGQDGIMVISVENNGAPLDQSHSVFLKSGMGMSNLDDRLNNLYGNEYVFEIKNNPNGPGVKTIIKIPLES